MSTRPALALLPCPARALVRRARAPCPPAGRAAPRMVPLLLASLLGTALPAPAARAEAGRCEVLSGSSDGVPAEYYRAVCRAEAALTAGDAAGAEHHYRQALAAQLPDASDYLLMPGLAEALCRQGRVAEAEAELRDFQCVAAIELGERGCDTRAGLTGTCAQRCAAPRPQACSAQLAVLAALRQHAAALLRDCAQAAQPGAAP